MGNEEIGSKSVLKNFIWCLMERWGAQGVTFVVSIILARLLNPEVYGIVAMSSVFTSILSVFVDSGLGSALVQKKDADELDFSSVFYFNVAASFILYVIIFFSAPWIARFYNMPELTLIVRISGIGLILAGVKNILISVIQRNLQYKKFFFATLGGTIGAAVIGIVMAFCGCGVWALIVQGLFNTFVDTVILWITVKWRPLRRFSIKRVRSLLKFGSRILLTYLFGTFYGKLRDLIIGKKYSATDLAFYNKASGWPNLIFTNIGGAVDSVMFPVMSRAQDDKTRIRVLISKTIQTNAFVLLPIFAGLAACCDSAVRIILTDKWLQIVPYMRIFCVSIVADMIGNTEMNAIRSIGRSDLFFRIDLVKKIIGLIAVAITMWISVSAMAYSLIFIGLVSLAINFVTIRRLTGYEIWGQIKDFLPSLIISLAMLCPVYLINYLHISNWVKLLIQIPLGIVLYVLFSWIFNKKLFLYCWDMAKSFRKKKEK